MALKSSLFILILLMSFFLTPSPLEAHHPGAIPSEGTRIAEEESISSGAMVNSQTAGTLGRNRAAVGFVFNTFRYHALPAKDAHELHHRGRDVHGKNHEEFYTIYGGWGVLEDLDLYLAAPIVSKTSIQIEDHDHLGRGDRATGFGDTRLWTKYRFWKGGVDAALWAGIKFPTGETSDKDGSGAKLEPEQQPGSGSWDGEFGIALSRNFLQRISLAASFQYTLKGEGAQDLKSGDVFRCNVGTSLAFQKLGVYPNLLLGAELNYEWALRDHSREERRVFDSGGTTLFVTPSLRLEITPNLSAFGAMPIPVAQDLGGEHEELKFEILTGMSLYF